MMTLTLPFDSGTADDAVGAWLRPFWVPLMYSSPHFPGGASAKYPVLVRVAKRALTVAESGQAAQLFEFEHATQCPGSEESATNSPIAACFAAATSTGVGVEPVTLDAGDDPQPTRNMTADTDIRARINFIVGGIVITFRLAVDRKPVVSMLVEHPARQLVTKLAYASPPVQSVSPGRCAPPSSLQRARSTKSVGPTTSRELREGRGVSSRPSL
jgi:hypothetical protein